MVRVQIANEADFARYRGKLAGKIVLAQSARRVRMLEGPDHPAHDREGHRGGRDDAGARAAGRRRPRQRGSSVSAEGQPTSTCRKASWPCSIAAATATWRPAAATSSWQQQHPDGGTIFPNGASPRDDKAGKSVPVIALAVEHYNRMIRVLDKNVPVKVELNVETKFYDESGPTASTPSPTFRVPDLASEIVLLGAHFDSHPYATGATDNATGSGAMMEAVRILKAVGAKPRRTIRVGVVGRGGAGAARLSCLRPRTSSPTSTRWR